MRLTRQRGFCDGVSTCVNAANKIIFGSGTRLITQTSKLMLSMLMLYWNCIPEFKSYIEITTIITTLT